MKKSKSKINPRQSFRQILPRKGTDLRCVMRAMLRTCGTTSFEIDAALGKKTAVSSHLSKIVDFLGYDVRQLPNLDKTRKGRVIYKIVGKDTDNGYRGFSFNAQGQ